MIKQTSSNSAYYVKSLLPLKMGFLVPLSLLVLVWSTLALDVRYVKPNNLSPLKCPGQPCLTLDQYAEETNVYFTTGATFVFLAGNHSLATELIIRNISDVTLGGNKSDVNVIYRNGATIECKNVSTLKVEGLTFIFDSKVFFSKSRLLQSEKVDTTAKNVLYSKSVFQRNMGIHSKAIWKAHRSSIEFIGNSFSTNTASIYGGAVYAYDSNIRLTDNAFVANVAVKYGGAVYAYGSNVTLINNIFVENKAGEFGGAVYANDSNVTLTDNVFSVNTAGKYGGALHINGSNITLTGAAFYANKGEYGGAVYVYGSNTTLINNTFTSNMVNISGGALCTSRSNITLNNNTYDANIANYSGGAIFTLPGNNIVMTGNNFSSNEANQYCGAVYTIESNLILRYNNFSSNKANHSGGAVCTSSGGNATLYLIGNSFSTNTANAFGGAVLILNECNITINGNNFTLNTANDFGGSVFALNGSNITMNGNYFGGNKANTSGGAVYTNHSNLIFNRNTFSTNTANVAGGAVLTLNAKNVTMIGNNFTLNAANHSGGAVYTIGNIIPLNLYLIDNRFCEDTANHSGGAVYAFSHRVSHIYLNGNTFKANMANHTGGAVHCAFNTTEEGHGKSNVTLNGNTFIGNTVLGEGGAVFVLMSIVTQNHNIFSENIADEGGAISSIGSNMILNGNIFSRNIARIIGGALFAINSSIAIKKTVGDAFTHNFAVQKGGALWLERCILDIENDYSPNKISSPSDNDAILQPHGTYFYNNTADSISGGGGVALFHGSKATFHNLNFMGNSGCALHVGHSNVTFSGTTSFTNNHGQIGGGIYLAMSLMLLSGYALFEGNTADYGGAISGRRSKMTLNGYVLFRLNTAREGGALHVSGCDVKFSKDISFVSNTATIGGAIYLNSVASLNFEMHTSITTSHNYASEYGGAVFHDDAPTPFQCNNMISHAAIDFLPLCFFVWSKASKEDIYHKFVLNSYNDSAGKAGNFLYGGLLDRCVLDLDSEYIAHPYSFLLHILKVKSTSRPVTSKPYRLLFCDKNNRSRIESRQVYRGQEFVVSLLALTQGNTTTSTLVTAKVSSTASLELNQSVQTLSNTCSALSYNLYSTESQEDLVLYADGPCRDIGTVTAVVKVTFLTCPDAFIQIYDRCICDKKLQAYGADCIVGEPSFIVRKAGSSFWMSALYNNSDSYQGLILYKSCPIEYCTSQSVNITLDNLDVQCDLNRSGVLCGACATNYSLMLGSSKCQVCSNSYLALLIPFAAVGIALVIFLTFLRLTVATGMINSLILYANIVQVNKHLFLPADQTSGFLTIFVAWLNLDLGIQTCFYDGMDAYAQTWLQFAFPVYVWILIGLIVFASRYSITVSKLIGSNPIAVLATLLLMSYAKILRIIIAVYSSVDLDYPDNKTVTVWLKDANVPYLQSKHLLVSVVISLILAFLFLPYTFLLLLGHKLYRYSDRKGLRWLNRIKPLLDSYYAPYKFHTRYWTGFLLLVRCALYLEFSLGTANKHLLAIIITFTVAAVVLASGRIYSKLYTNIVEISLYLNLVILSAATATCTNHPALVYTLVGIAFVTMVGIFVYHFHISYTTKILTLKGIMFHRTADQAAYTHLLNTASTSHDQKRVVTRTYVSIREPLLEN